MSKKGYCQCGCGKKTGVIKKNDSGRGHKAGEYLKFIKGHNVKFFKVKGKDNYYYGADFKGSKSPSWKGGRNRNNGYIDIHCPSHPYARKGTYVFEHRLVVEGQIGRYLLSTEKVHHLGAKDDNRPKMLMAFKNNGIHRRFEKTGKAKPEDIIFDGREL